MKLLVDTHTHTIASGHAYSTLKENAQEAYKKGLEGFVCADHGPMIEGCVPSFILSSVLRFVPEMVEGVRMIKGAEANIMDYDGTIDIADQHMKYTEFGVASLHSVTIKDGGVVKNTDALLGALHNPYIDVIGHSGNPQYPIDAEAYVKGVAKLNKLVEINNHSFEFRTGSDVNCVKIMNLCKKYGVRITVSSDAHICYHIGEFGYAVAALAANNFPEELIVSASIGQLLGYIKEKRAFA